MLFYKLLITNVLVLACVCACFSVVCVCVCVPMCVARQVLELIEAGQRLQAPVGAPAWCAQLMAQCFEFAPEARPTFKAIFDMCASKAPL